MIFKSLICQGTDLENLRKLHGCAHPHFTNIGNSETNTNQNNPWPGPEGVLSFVLNELLNRSENLDRHFQRISAYCPCPWTCPGFENRMLGAFGHNVRA